MMYGENNYNLKYSDDEKAMTYLKAIIKAVQMTHEVTAKSEMIGIVYDYEAKHCVAKETIKKCLEKILKSSNVFTKKEIEYLLK